MESLDVAILRPVLEVAVTAAAAARVRPEQVTVTELAAREAPSVTVILLDANDAEDATPFTPQKEVAGNTLVITEEGNVKVICPPLESSVDVVKAMVAVLELPTAWDMVKADAATAVTAPTAGVSAVPNIVSTVVLTERPPTVALLATKVNPEHVTVTIPALTAVFTVITTASELNAAEDAALGLGTNSQNVDPLTTDETSPPGKATVILSPTGRLVEVENEIEAV